MVEYCLCPFSYHIFFYSEDDVFVQGDMAVYPAHGVGLIEAIETKSIGGVDQSFYVMRILNNDMTIMIPTATSQNGIKKHYFQWKRSIRYWRFSRSGM